MAKKKTTKHGAPAPSLFMPRGHNKDLKPSELLLDPANLRLMESADESLSKVDPRLIGQPALQRRVFDVLNSSDDFDVDGLRTSILANTFLKHERLIVAPFDEDQYIVLEGNRRLTAVKSILSSGGKDVPRAVLESIETLPCLVLEGEPDLSLSRRLEYFRKQAEVYVGMRHLMGAKEWEPASRYEFQARLIDEGWDIGDVAKKFNRTTTEVLRDLTAHRLFRDFKTFERKRKLSHQLTYNAFAEAARSRAIKEWIGWSNESQTVENRQNEESLFHYIISELSSPQVSSGDDEDPPRKKSTEAVVRQLSRMLTLEDEEVSEALSDRDFRNAQLIYESRKEGKLPKRIQSFIRSLKNVSTGELSGDLKELRNLIATLIAVATGLKELIEAKMKRIK